MLVNPIPYGASPDARLNDKPWSCILPARELRCLVDADMLVYGAGFAVEHNEYLLYAHGDMVGHFKNKDSLNKWLKRVGKKEEDFEIDVLTWDEGLDSAILNLRGMKKAIVRASMTQKHSWYLTKGSSLWRNQDAHIQGYKANREGGRKPIYYDDLRQFMIDSFKAKLLAGLEADDAVAALSRENPGKMIIASGDKDLLTVPGLHLRLGKVKDGVKFQSELAACRMFYTQMLAGDTIDNIKGLKGTKSKPGWGMTGASNAMMQFTTERQMADFVASLYQDKFADGFLCPDGTQLTWWQVMEENANLLFLRREHDTKFKYDPGE